MNIEELKLVGIEIKDEYKDGIFLIDIYTVWCAPCKFVAPILHKLRDEGLVHLLQVDLDQNRPLGEIFSITAIPTLIFFKDGKLLEKSIEVQGQQLVRNGLMIGAAGESILREILANINH